MKCSPSAVVGLLLAPIVKDQSLCIPPANPLIEAVRQ